MATIDDVAKLAGVSTATVSRVINGSYKVKTARHDKVIWAMEQLDYSLPQRLASADAPIKVLVISNRATRQYTEIIDGLESVSEKYNVALVYKFVRNFMLGEEILPQEQEYDGIILCDVDIDEALYKKLQAICPLVLCRKQYAYPGYISVSIDDQKAGYDLTSALIERGRRNIFFYREMIYKGDCPVNIDSRSFIPRESIYQRKRYAGYLLACLENGITIPDEYAFYQNVPLDMWRSRELTDNPGIERLFSSPNRPDAVIVREYYPTHQLMLIAEKCGLKVDEDIVFATFDPPVFLDSMEFPHVRQPYDKIADVTLKVLRDVINGTFNRYDHLEIYLNHVLEGFD